MARRAGLQRHGRRGRDAPSAEGRARLRFGSQAQHDEADAGDGCRPRQPAARRQVQHIGCSPQFQHHRAQSRTARGLVSGAQSLKRIARFDEDEGRRGPERDQTVWMDTPMLPDGHRLLHPDDGAPSFSRHAQSQPQPEAAGSTAIRHTGGEDLMRGLARQSAIERLVHGLDAQRKPFRQARIGPFSRIDAGKPLPEPGKGILLSHVKMFLFCSIKTPIRTRVNIAARLHGHSTRSQSVADTLCHPYPCRPLCLSGTRPPGYARARQTADTSP